MQWWIQFIRKKNLLSLFLFLIFCVLIIFLNLKLSEKKYCVINEWIKKVFFVTNKMIFFRYWYLMKRMFQGNGTIFFSVILSSKPFLLFSSLFGLFPSESINMNQKEKEQKMRKRVKMVYSIKFQRKRLFHFPGTDRKSVV